MKQIDRIREMEACLDISAAAARALSDALDQFEMDKKMNEGIRQRQPLNA